MVPRHSLKWNPIVIILLPAKPSNGCSSPTSVSLLGAMRRCLLQSGETWRVWQRGAQEQPAFPLCFPYLTPWSSKSKVKQNRSAWIRNRIPAMRYQTSVCTFNRTMLCLSGLCTEFISKDLRILFFFHNLSFLKSYLFATCYPASLHQHCLCKKEVWEMKKPSSLLLLFVLQKQQRWNSGFVAINRAHTKTLKGRISLPGCHL